MEQHRKARWLFHGDKSTEKIAQIVEELGDHAITKFHARHLSIKRCKDIGLKITDLEASQETQDAVLSVHHACMLTLSGTPAVKIIENHNGNAFIRMQVAQNAPQP